jgi:co-chaperonin GroES (HSP10)
VKSLRLARAAGTNQENSRRSTSRSAIVCLFGKWSGTEGKLDCVEYLIMKETDILGVLTEAAAERKVA